MKNTNKSNVGRKKMLAIEKKQPVQVYMPGTAIKQIGGINKARQIALEALNNAIPKW